MEPGTVQVAGVRLVSVISWPSAGIGDSDCFVPQAEQAETREPDVVQVGSVRVSFQV